MAHLRRIARSKLSLKNNFPTFSDSENAGCRKDSDTWSDDIVPLTTLAQVFDVELLHLGIRHLLSFYIDTIQQSRSDGQSCPSGRPTKIGKHRVQTAQRLARPIPTDLAEQAMLDGIPFGAPGRIVANRHSQPIAVAHLCLQWVLQAAWTTPIAATGIRQDQEPGGLRKPLAAHIAPPARHRRHGKLRWIGRRTDIHRPSPATHLIDPIRDSTHYRILRKVMHIDSVSFLAPGSSGIFARCH